MKKKLAIGIGGGIFVAIATIGGIKLANKSNLKKEFATATLIKTEK